MSEETVGVIAFTTLGLLLLTLGIRSLMVRAPGRRGEVLACRQCRSVELATIPSNGISRHPGYRCTMCGLRMRPPGSGFLYTVVLVLSLSLLALFALPLWGGGSGPAVVYPFMVVVAGYSAWQLRRPIPLQQPRPDTSSK